MLTRRSVLEPNVHRCSAPARALAPSEQDTTWDEKGAGPFFTGCEQLVENGPPPCGHGPCSVRRVGATLLEALLRMEDTLGAAIADPVAGESVRWSLKPNGLRKQGGKRRASREQARAGKWRRSSALPDALQVPGGLGKGAQALGVAGLSSRHAHELTTKGVRAKRIGVTTCCLRGPHGPRGWMVSCAAKADLALTR